MIAADHLLSQRAALTPNREALFDAHTGHRYTYAQLNARANRAANFLRKKLGVQKGDRVSILAHNGPAYFDLFFGLAKLGAIFAPLNWRLTAHELAFILNDCEPRVFFVGPEFANVFLEMQANLKIAHIVGLENAALPSALNYEIALASASDAEPERPPLDADDAYCLLYTSGTTGRPKGAMIPHRQVLWNAINTCVSWGLNENDVSPIFTPLFHAGGLFAFMTSMIYLGGRLVLTRTFDAETSLRLIEQEKCTVILGVPTLFQMWANTAYFTEADFSCVRFFISGGAPCPPALIEHWRNTKGVVFRQGYGLTEVGPNCFSMTDAESRLKTGSVGKPIFHTQMLLVNPETGQPAPPGAPGELLIRGPHVCTGYWRRPEATQEVLKEGWFHTGDMARTDPDGFFYIVGRFKDMIKSGGENVYAAEVEAVFREHPAIADAALIGQPDEKWGEVGLMIVLPHPGLRVTEEELLTFCASRLAKFKIPKRVIFTEALPYSPYGKIAKAELRARYIS